MAIGSSEFDYIRDLVLKHSALVLEPGKEYLVESRLAPIAHLEGFPSLSHFVQHLRTNRFGALHRKVVEAMATNETTFFRDARPFEVLKTLVLPDLVKKRSAKRCLKVWCAACSSGQEPYSFAMLLREHFPAVLGWNLRVMASDISSDVLARAREGRYTQFEVNRGLPAALLVKYFKRQHDQWQLSPEILRMVEFVQINLCETWPTLPNMDLILMRNVLIYFDAEVKRVILGKVRRLLNADGYLLLGAAESTVNLDDSFEPIPIDRPAWYRLRRGANNSAS